MHTIEAFPGAFLREVFDVERSETIAVLFPEKPKVIKQIGGLFKDATIDYDAIKKELRELSRKSEEHLLQEWADEQ